MLRAGALHDPALADQCTRRDVTDRTTAITAAHVEAAKETIIKGALDLLITCKTQRSALELKMRHRRTAEARGVAQLSGYL